MQETFNIESVKGVVRRRWKIFTIIFSLIFLADIIVAVILPPVYKSVGRILIEGQQIPSEFVQSTITTFVEERIEMIKQQIFTRKNLIEIIDEFNLYPELKDRKAQEQIIGIMRNAISIQRVMAGVQNPRTGRAQVATIAFDLSYEGRDPNSVYKVANKLTSLFLEEDLRRRAQMASTTTSFLEEEQKRLEKDIRNLESEISTFKTEHIGELPENTNTILQTIGRYERELDHVDTQIRTLREKKVSLQGQLAVVDPFASAATGRAGVPQNPEEQLRMLRLQLIGLQSTLSAKHPDIKKLKREIQELEAEVGKVDVSREKIENLKVLRAQLTGMRGKMGPKHPDVVRISKEIDMLSKEVSQVQASQAAGKIDTEIPDNPAYIRLKTQISANEITIKNLLQERAGIKTELDDYYKRLESIPTVEKAYSELMRGYMTLKNKYADISKKLMTAKISQGMEQSQRGEKFTIADPPQLPRRPYKPNRPAILLLGFILALGAGIGVAVLKERADYSIKSPSELKKITGVAVFSAVPLIENEEEKRTRWIKKVLWASAALGAVAVALVLINRLVMPLDILWIKIQNRLFVLI